MASDEEMDYANSSDYESDRGSDDYGFDLTHDDEPISRLPQASYVVLSEGDIGERQAKEISQVMAILSVSDIEAGILLRHFKWSAVKVNEEWFQDEESVRSSVGLLSKPAQEESTDVKERLTCNICFDEFTRDNMKAAVCRHYFCDDCWRGYIQNAVSEGPGCLGLRCPLPTCNAAVGQDMVLGLASEDFKTKYTRYLLRSYVEDNRKTKWCPGPGCDYAVELDVFSTSYDIVCKCNYNFCWNCLQDAHRPVDCQTVMEWMQKNSTEAENTNWILANSKPCPKCKRPIEKNQGCMHMSCTPPCKFEFCWLCLGAWSDHGERTGGFYACNRYETAKQEGVYDETERRREMAKNSLEKYTHFYERWNANEHSRVKALDNLKEMQSDKMEQLGDKQCQPVSQLKFVMEAWLQIVECRRVLKWTYAYGYYLKEDEVAKRQFFEYLQGEAESGLERLHNCAEKELSAYLGTAGGQGVEPPSVPFNDFRTKLAGLTSVTRTYFENLVKALENNLADVKEDTGSKHQKGGRLFEGSSSRNAKGGKGKGKGGSSSAARSRANADDGAHWACEQCTFANVMTTSVCAICSGPRPPGV